ncbi:MAG: hypothetical protein CVV37_05595 [Nitrospira bacterium HGW-Nitrospira-1]|nr:MAG: hypothetical protein CVV37_05595 [Nitrospira bacterium HGW-Nitrospira-1]
MDLNIILWIGGMLFSLGIFAFKVGFGLGFSRLKWKGILMTLSLYLMLFVVVAALSGHLIKLLEPVLRKGPYLHALMAMGMIVWGVYIVRQSGSATVRQTNVKNPVPRAQGVKSQNKFILSFSGLTPASSMPSRGMTEGGRAMTQIRKQFIPVPRAQGVLAYSLKFKIQNSKNSSLITHHPSLLLLIPCPVCLTAMTFSTWAALNVIKLPAPLIGLGLGVVFIALSLAFYFSLKLVTRYSSLVTQRISLGLGMIAIGLYFISSLILPAKIEEARGMYGSFVADSSGVDINNTAGVLAVLLITALIGYFVNTKKEDSK